jgi:hypothetical protein
MRFDIDDIILDVYDITLREDLFSYLKEIIKEKAKDFKPLIECAITEAKKVINTDPTYKTIPEKEEEKIIKILKSRAKSYIKAVLKQFEANGKVMKVYENIKAYSSVFLVGAGLSYESNLPLAQILDSILKFVGAKDYQELQVNQKLNHKSQKFKLVFKEKYDIEAHPGRSHELIALNFPEYIKEVICLNWDNLIEKAFKECNKKIEKINKDDNIKVKVKDINKGGYLWKFHGDVEDIDYDWIFPNHPGRVFKNFIHYYTRNEWLKDNLFVFVIVGYSEKEKNISDNVIKLLEKRRKHVTYRIGLEFKRFHHKNYIFGPADVVLELIFTYT